jgi:hypothetical protein
VSDWREYETDSVRGYESVDGTTRVYRYEGATEVTLELVTQQNPSGFPKEFSKANIPLAVLLGLIEPQPLTDDEPTLTFNRSDIPS